MNSGKRGGGENVSFVVAGFLAFPKRDGRDRRLSFCLGAMCSARTSNQVHVCLGGFLRKLVTDMRVGCFGHFRPLEYWKSIEAFKLLPLGVQVCLFSPACLNAFCASQSSFGFFGNSASTTPRVCSTQSPSSNPPCLSEKGRCIYCSLPIRLRIIRGSHPIQFTYLPLVSYFTYTQGCGSQPYNEPHSYPQLRQSRLCSRHSPV